YAQQTDGQMGIFPNPASGGVNIVYPGLEGKATLAIVAGDGRVMRRMDIGQTGAARTVVDISGLANGSYWVRITQPGGFDYARRLVVAQSASPRVAEAPQAAAERGHSGLQVLHALQQLLA